MTADKFIRYSFKLMTFGKFNQNIPNNCAILVLLLWLQLLSSTMETLLECSKRKDKCKTQLDHLRVGMDEKWNTFTSRLPGDVWHSGSNFENGLRDNANVVIMFLFKLKWVHLVSFDVLKNGYVFSCWKLSFWQFVLLIFYTKTKILIGNRRYNCYPDSVFAKQDDMWFL